MRIGGAIGFVVGVIFARGMRGWSEREARLPIPCG